MEGGIRGFGGQNTWVWIPLLLAVETEQITEPQRLGFFIFMREYFLPSRVFVGIK